MNKRIENNQEGFARLNGYSICQEKGQVVMVISPENSYYTNEGNNNIKDHLECCVDNFSKVYVMIPEGPMVHDYLAEGVDIRDAVVRSRLKCNNVKHKAERGIEGLVNKGFSKEKLEILDWVNNIDSNNDYLDALNLLRGMYEENKEFNGEVNNAVLDVLMSRKKSDLSSSAIEEGSKYVLKELAFVIAGPRMLNQTKMCYTYHKPWNIVERYIAGAYDGKEKKDLGFVVIN